MFMAAFTSAFALYPQATHTKVAWLLRLWAAMCLQELQVCDVYAALTFSTLPGAFCASRVTRSPHPDLRMPRLSPVFCATFLPGFSMVPRAERVIPLTLRFSTRITSKRRARSVVVFSTQSLRRSPSLAFNRPTRVLTFLRRFDPRAARASLRCSRRSRPASFRLGPPGLVISPVDSATATVTHRSTPTTPPVPGAGIGSGITANAICQRPALSRVMRYDFQPAKARLRLNCTQPIFADQHARACPVVLPDPQRLRADNPQALMLAGFTPPRAPVGPGKEAPPPLVKVPHPLLLTRLRPAGQPRLRSPGRGQLCGLGIEARRGPFPAPPHQGLPQAEVPHVSGVGALLQQEHFLRVARIQAEPHGTQRSGGLRHPDGNQTPILAVVAASPATCTSTWCSPPSTAVACPTRRCSTCANTSWRRCVQTSGRPWPSSTESKTMFTYSCSTRPRWRSPTSSTPSKASHPGGYGRTSPAESTRLQPAAGSGPRHTSPDHAVARHCPQSRTRSEEHTTELQSRQYI